MKPLFGGFSPMAMMHRDDGAIRWMADDVRGNRRRWGSGVPPARRGWCRGESRHATLRFAYRVMEECRRSATRECKPRDDVYTTALRRFFAYGGVLRRWGNPGSRLYNRSSAVFRLWRCIAPMGQSSLRRFFRIAPMGASCRNEVFVMRLFCVGFCKIGK